MRKRIRTALITTSLFLMIVISIILIAGCNANGSSTIDKCAGTQIEALEGCYDNGKIYFNLRNKGTDISGIKAFLEANYNISISIDGAIEPGAPIRKRLDFGNQGINGFKTLTIRPLIKEGQTRIVGKKKSLRIELRPCAQQE